MSHLSTTVRPCNQSLRHLICFFSEEKNTPPPSECTQSSHCRNRKLIVIRGALLPRALQRIVELLFSPSSAIDNSPHLSKLKLIMSYLHHSSLTVTLLLSVVLLLVTRTLAAPPQLDRLIANPAPPFNIPPVADVSSVEEGTAAV